MCEFLQKLFPVLCWLFVQLSNCSIFHLIVQEAEIVRRHFPRKRVVQWSGVTILTEEILIFVESRRYQAGLWSGAGMSRAGERRAGRRSSAPVAARPRQTCPTSDSRPGLTLSNNKSKSNIEIFRAFPFSVFPFMKHRQQLTLFVRFVCYYLVSNSLWDSSLIKI